MKAHVNPIPTIAEADAEEIVNKIPLTVVGSDESVMTPDGHKVCGRACPQGVVEANNEQHCDFIKLRQMLVHALTEEVREDGELLSMGIIRQ